MSLTSTFYGPTGLTDEQAVSIIRKAYDLGVRLFNTSDLYGPYKNEELVGEALEGKADVALSTKWGPMFEAGKGIVSNYSPEYCRKACEGALKRLRVPSITLFTLRGPVGPEWDLKATMSELKALVGEGKIQYLGLSEVSADQIRACHAVHPISAVEIEYSLFTRDVESDILPTCRELGIGIMAYSPLGRGMLTGAIKTVDQLGETDFRRRLQPRFDALEQNLALVAEVERMAASKGCTPAQLALAWLLAKGPDVFPIPGTKSETRLIENMGALGVSLSEADVAALEAAVPADKVVGSRYADMRHTYHGSGKAHH